MSILDFPPEETPTYQPVVPDHRVLSDEILTYESATGASLAVRRLGVGAAAAPATSRVATRAPVAMAVMLAVLVVAVLTAVGVALAAEGTRLTSVQFDLERGGAGAGSGGPLSAGSSEARASYHSAVVSNGGVEQILQPLAGPVSVSLSERAAGSMAAERDGLRVGPAAAGFGDALADVLSSRSLARFARIESPGSAVTVDLTSGRPLERGDHVLVQELGGDAKVQLVALGADGAPMGATRSIGPSYQWNTGHGTADGADFWVEVLAVSALGGDEPVHGIRVVATTAELKVVAFEPGSAPSLPDPTARETAVTAPGDASGPGDGSEPSQTGDQPAFAAIGLGLGVVPAVAVDGAGCEQAVANGGNSPGPGESATFCFAVTNTGTVDVTDISITDGRVGLVDAVLPRADGPEVLAPGQQVIFYHYATVEPGAGGGSARATARPAVDGAPKDDPGLEPAMAEAAADVIEGAEPAPEEPEAAGASTGSATSPADMPDGEAADPAPVPETTPTAESQPTGSAIGPLESDQAPTALAMTGMPTEPWSLVVLAMGLIFFGYTAVSAFREPSPQRDGLRGRTGESAGHEQLDALGFD